MAGGAETISSSEATMTLWNACGAWAGTTMPTTAVMIPKPTADTAMRAAMMRTARSRPTGVAPSDMDP